MAEEYMDERRVYLWKKLIIDQNPPDRIFQMKDFISFGEEETSFKGTVRLANYLTHPQGIMLSLIQLTEEDFDCLKIKEAGINDNIISEYHQACKTFYTFFSEEKKYLIGLYAGNEKKVLKDKKEINKHIDPFCGLTEPFYKKVKKGENFSVSELTKLVLDLGPSVYFRYLHFKIQVDKEKLLTHLNTYIDKFIAGVLILPPNTRYFKLEEQRNNILAGLRVLGKKYDVITTNFSEIAENGGIQEKDKAHYRFWETLFALEKMGEIIIKNLQKDEITLTLTKTSNTDGVMEYKRPADKIYLDIDEPIKLKTLDIIIKGDYITHNRTRTEKLNPTDKQLLYFLFHRYLEDKQMCSTKEVLVERLGRSTGNIKNRISAINQQVRKLIPNGKTSSVEDLIKLETRRGYRLNPRFMIRFINMK